VSVLEASFVVFLLHPHHRNFGKRLIKSPKLYFLDTGLRRTTCTEVRNPTSTFWRDASGHEIDILIDRGRELIPVEVKSAQTFVRDFLWVQLFWWTQRACSFRDLAPAQE
jgi:hypothetical protein